MDPKIAITVGTIHTFQGSECDLIIFDMVDGLWDLKNNLIPIGNLYHGKTGEQLITVAFSRARSKLIIVGCTKVFWKGLKHGQVRMSIKRVFKKAETFSTKL